MRGNPIMVFDCTTADVNDGFKGVFTLLCVSFSWSASSKELYQCVKQVESELPLAVRFMDGDSDLDFCTKNNILSGAGGLKVFQGGRETCVRRPSGSVYTITYPLVRPSQIVELINAIVEASKIDSIASVNW